jgi:hypothetical protein
MFAFLLSIAVGAPASGEPGYPSACLDPHTDRPGELAQRIEACRQIIGDSRVGLDSRAEAYLRRAMAYAQRAEQTGRADDMDRAISDLSDGLRLDDNASARIYVYQNRAGLYFHKGNYDRALADYTKLLELMPDTATIYGYRAVVFAAKQDYPGAISDFTEAIRREPSADLYAQRALSHLQAGKPSEALADADRAVALAPDDAATYAPRVVINRAAGRTADVIRDLRKALSLDPSNDLIKAELQSEEAKQPVAAAKPAEPAPSPAATAFADSRRDYELTAQVGTRDAWEAYLRQYPAGFYAELARAQLGKLGAPAQADDAKADREAAARAETDHKRLADEKAAQEKAAAEAEREKQRLAKEQAEQKKLEQARIAAEQAKKAEEEKAARERVAAEEKAAKQKAAAEAEHEKQRIAREQAEQKRQEQARIAAEQAKKAEEENAARERAAAEKQAQEAAAKAKAAEEARLAAEKAKQAERARLAEEARAAELQKQSDTAKAAELERARSAAEASSKDKPSDEKPAGQLALLNPPDKSDDGKPAAEQVPRLLLTELRRLGCFTGSIDGSWNEAAQKSVRLFNKHAGTKLDTKLASLDTLDVVKHRSERVCPLVCEHGSKPDGNTCTKILCKSGYELDDDDDCVRTKKKPETTKHERTPEAAPEAKPGREGPSSTPTGAGGGHPVLGHCAATSCSGALRGCMRKAEVIGRSGAGCQAKYESCMQTGTFAGRFCHDTGLARN